MTREEKELGREEHLAQFAPDLSSEPPMWSAEELAAANAELERRIKQPMDLSGEPF